MTPFPLFAQAEAVGGATSELLKYGLLGIFCILLIAALVWCVKGWRASWEARLQDAKDYAAGLKEVNDATNKVTIEANRCQDAVKAAVDDLESSNTREHGEVKEAFRAAAADMKEASARECKVVKEAVGGVQQEIGRLKDEQVELRTALAPRGRR